ncbi:MAG: hypothetical protein LBR80_16995 [Deltaproteobacteria bacterium]|nr:hypothetical protein [Deltaproteobacteria bacterium]
MSGCQRHFSAGGGKPLGRHGECWTGCRDLAEAEAGPRFWAQPGDGLLAFARLCLCDEADLERLRIQAEKIQKIKALTEIKEEKKWMS